MKSTLRAVATARYMMLCGTLVMVGCGDLGSLDPSALRGLPSLLSARALSEHYVEAGFDGPAPEFLASPDAYRVVAASDGSQLAIRSVRLSEDRKSAILTTDAQQEIDYRLSFGTETQAAGTVAAMALTFSGSTTPEMSLGYAVALSNTSVLLTFGDAVDAASAEVVSNYGIHDPDLGVSAAVRGSSTNTVILTTSSQSDALYSVKVANLLASGGNSLIDPDANTATFYGLAPEDTTLPRLVAAEALDYQTVVLTFSERMQNHVSDPLNYSISPNLTIVGLTVNEWGSQATLSVLPMTAGTQYTVTVVNAEDRAGNVIDPAQNTATFGIAADESIAPRLAYAASINATTVILTFSEPMSANVADAANYVITPSIAVTDALVNDFGTRVTLTTQPQTLGTQYEVRARNVGDSVGNPIDPNADSATFTFDGTPDEDLVGVLPRLTGAASTSNRSVVVSFNKAMSDSVLNPSNYVIVQENVQPEAGYLTVTDAAFLDTGRKAVELATFSQNELTYRLTVVNVEDLQGNQIAPKELLVDPASVLFAGTPPTCTRTCRPQSANPGGLNGLGECNSDNDCDDDAPCQLGEQDCRNACTNQCELTDMDGDGLSDAEEQRGWVVVVELTTKRGENGDREIVRREVTSNPLVADTDQDGLDDGTEKAIATDPRDRDTDDDLVPDELEYNLYYTNPADQDSDNDDTDDFLEIDFFRTSPIMADTDGDGFDDSDELYERSRNPLVADLPVPQITVADISLELNITSSYTDEEGTTESIEDTTSSTFTQSQTDTLGTSSTTSTQSENEFGQELGAQGGCQGPVCGFQISGSVSFGESFANGYSSTVDSQSAATSQQEYQDSITHALEQSQSRSVTRTIDSAIVQATVNLSNKSDIAFSITNLELSMLQQDRQAGLTFRPIAALRVAGADDPLSQPVFNLGPNEPERGPIIFENTTVFPNRIDALMREPVGLVFDVVNFDVLDEEGRNLVFTLQDVTDRTVALTLDFGDGRVEDYHIATASEFGADGRMVGIDMRRALEIIGITEAHPPAIDLANTYRTLLQDRTLEDGSTIQVEALHRLRDVQNSADGKKFWTAVSSNTNLDPNQDFSTVPLHAHDSMLLMYTSDVDEDGLFLREEYLYGSSDDSADTDGDGLSDFDEVRTGWTVSKIPGLPYEAFPSPARADSDLDGLDDKDESKALTDPNRSDTDEDGLSDPSELNDTYDVVLFDGDADITNDQILEVSPYTDWVITAGPDGVCDTVSGIDPRDAIVTIPTGTGAILCVRANAADGVIRTTPAGDDIAVAAPKIAPGPNGICDSRALAGDDVQEWTGTSDPLWRVKVGTICVSAGLNDVIDTPIEGDDFVRAVHTGYFGTDPVNEDTDFDGITDGREIEIGTNPNSSDAGRAVDTDGDGLFDNEEDAGWLVDGVLVTSDKNESDTDRDGIPDVVERAIGTNPRSSDTDGDTLLDYEEFDSGNPTVNGTPMFDSVVLAAALQQCTDAVNCSYSPPGQPIGTDPGEKDTDGDTRDDNIELTVSWIVDTFESDPYPVLSDPTSADWDVDGLNDAEEMAIGTDWFLADTDGDDTSDKDEDLASGTDRNPLRQDRRITLDVTKVRIVQNCEDFRGGPGEFEGKVFLVYPDGSEVELENLDGDCDNVDEGRDCTLDDSSAKTFFVYGTQQTTFRLRSTGLKEFDSSSTNEDPQEFDVPFSYPVLSPQTSVTVTDPNHDACELQFFWTITVE